MIYVLLIINQKGKLPLFPELADQNLFFYWTAEKPLQKKYEC
jgi:hypothetical protein